jgi:hypothetical protein
MGGVAEHNYRRARAAVDDLPWDTLVPADYPADLLQATQRVWTNVALSEYAAVAQFSQMVTALARAKAPLDLIGMTADFVADEVRHVELASRLLVQFGGAAALPFEPERLTHALQPTLSPLQQANELALRIGFIGEAFASGTASVLMRGTGHALVRHVYEEILRDEARHTRFGSLYFEWAVSKLDDAERSRLSTVAMHALRGYSRLWNGAQAAPADTRQATDPERRSPEELGWAPADRYRDLAVQVVREQIVPNLRGLGLTLPDEELDVFAARSPRTT